jgi:hypothetical protein
MSRTIEIPDEDYARIQQAAAREGMAVEAWVVERARSVHEEERGARAQLPRSSLNGSGPRTMAELLAGRLGRFNSGRAGLGSPAAGMTFGDYLEEKQRQGRL